MSERNPFVCFIVICFALNVLDYYDYFVDLVWAFALTYMFRFCDSLNIQYLNCLDYSREKLRLYNRLCQLLCFQH